VTRATRVGVALAGLLLVALAASGAWLWWKYRPDHDQWIRTVHLGAAIALLVVAVVLVVMAIARRARTGGAGIVAAVGVLFTVGGAYVTGRLLPWDQLALGTVTSARDIGGVQSTFDEDVRFMIVRAREVATSTYHWWAVAHLALSALVVLALVLVWWRTGERAVSRRLPPPPPPPADRAQALRGEPAE
jgi:hypothetical protein